MKITLTRALLIVWLPLLLLLSGCVTKAVSKEDRSKIAVLKLDPNVTKPTRFWYFGPGSGEVIRDYAEQAGVLIEKIVMEEISTPLRESGKMKVSDSPNTSIPTFHVRIIMYGFSTPTTLSSNLLPVLSVMCDITDSRGKILWRDEDSVSLLESPAHSVPRDKLLTNPKVIEDAWRVAAKQIAKNIVEKLESQLDQPKPQ